MIAKRLYLFNVALIVLVLYNPSNSEDVVGIVIRHFGLIEVLLENILYYL